MLTNIKKLTWARGDPAEWIEAYEGKVPFACFCCRLKTAEFRATMPDGFCVVNAVLCPDCIKLSVSAIIAGMTRND